MCWLRRLLFKPSYRIIVSFVNQMGWRSYFCINENGDGCGRNVYHDTLEEAQIFLEKHRLEDWEVLRQVE